jgi:hypothetical protein
MVKAVGAPSSDRVRERPSERAADVDVRGTIALVGGWHRVRDRPAGCDVCGEDVQPVRNTGAELKGL